MMNRSSRSPRDVMQGIAGLDGGVLYVSGGPVKWSLLERSRGVRAIHRRKREQRGSSYGSNRFHIGLDASAKDFIRPECGCLESASLGTRLSSQRNQELGRIPEEYSQTTVTKPNRPGHLFCA